MVDGLGFYNEHRVAIAKEMARDKLLGIQNSRLKYVLEKAEEVLGHGFEMDLTSLGLGLMTDASVLEEVQCGCVLRLDDSVYATARRCQVGGSWNFDRVVMSWDVEALSVGWNSRFLLFGGSGLRAFSSEGDAEDGRVVVGDGVRKMQGCFHGNMYDSVSITLPLARAGGVYVEKSFNNCEVGVLRMGVSDTQERIECSHAIAVLDCFNDCRIKELTILNADIGQNFDVARTFLRTYVGDADIRYEGETWDMLRNRLGYMRRHRYA